MASNPTLQDIAQPETSAHRAAAWAEARSTLRELFLPLASLRLTVVLFALSIFIILVGTLAQTEKNMLDVLEDYFHTWLARIEVSVFFPPAWFPKITTALMRTAFGAVALATTGVLTAVAYALVPREQAARVTAVIVAVLGCCVAFSGMIRGAFWFPGGATIGLALAVNLLSAHLLRFRIQARGLALYAGLGIIAVGAFVTWLIIASGNNRETLQGLPIDGTVLWWAFKGVVGVLWLAGAAVAVAMAIAGWFRRVEFWVFAVPLMLVGCFVVWMWLPDSYLGDSGMRILWQLIQASVAGAILLSGCMLVFKRRGGIVLIHGGVALLMLGELLVTLFAVEGQIVVKEGKTASFMQDIRRVELAVVDQSNAKVDQVVVIPEEMLDEGRSLEHEWLPFDVHVDQYMANTRFRSLPSGNVVLPTVQEAGRDFQNPATAGAGRAYAAVPARKISGTDTNQEVDYASAYVTFRKKKTGQSLGTFLLSQLLTPQTVEVAGKPYDVDLRFKRMYRPYQVQLLDVRKDDYLGTNTPRNYASKIRLIDPTRNVDRETTIWMNNPLRYAGETFYQSSYYRDPMGEETSTLQVVTNMGWMIPYVACMLVVIGLLAHFGQTLLRFLNRRATGAGATAEKSAPIVATVVDDRAPDAYQPPMFAASEASDDKTSAWLPIAFPLLIAALGAAWIVASMRPSSDPEGSLAINRAAGLPVVYQGRVKPLDTLARNSLRIISEKQTFTRALSQRELDEKWPEITDKILDEWDQLTAQDIELLDHDPEALVELIVRKTDQKRANVEPVVDNLTSQRGQPAMLWLLDVISHAENAERHRVFRIKNLELQNTLRLTRRKRFRYAFDEFSPRLDAFKEQVRLARSLDKAELATYQRKVLELNTKIELYLALREAHRLPEQPPGETDVDTQIKLISFGAELADSRAPRVVPTDHAQRSWEPLATAATANWIQQLARAKVAKTTRQLAGKLADEFFDDERVDALVGAQIQSMIAEILRSRNPQLSDSEVRERAQIVADTMPDHIRETIQPAAAKFVDEQRAAFTSQLSTMLTTVVGGDELGQLENSAAATLAETLRAYRSGDTATFNRGLAAYTSELRAMDPQELSTSGSLLNRAVTATFGSFYEFEAYFNKMGPFDIAYWLYLLAFVLAALAWLGWSQPLNRAAFWLIMITFLLHTAALAARIYISGRPPVTNLYSSAVFIGWGCVVMGILLEVFFRLGIGNLVASVAGVATLGVAYQLAADGDTFVVLQAVLDTQFWLATHVVCITLGYSATFLAGFLGVAYIILGVLTPRLTPHIGKELCRMIYGTLCFAIFFSFWGTVLGGLWADDSWGRFWGWDPKENGAMIIVLWNALVLHARWGAMIKERGLAVLAVAGNIATAWSWFGVNELGIGLHSYGFTEGVLLTLSVFVASQLLLIAIGSIPTRLWLSARQSQIPGAGAA